LSLSFFLAHAHIQLNAILHKQFREHVTNQDDEDECEGKKLEVTMYSKKFDWPDQVWLFWEYVIIG